ncbi:MAG: hypothetical protein AB8G95_19240 [Anaerolineae bacterium]
MFNNNITNYDNKLANSVQQDYLNIAANRRLSKIARGKKAQANNPLKWIASLVTSAAA